MFDRNDPPGLGAHLDREDRWTVCYDGAKSEVELSPYLFNKKYGTSISDADWGEMVDNGVFQLATLDGLAIERAEKLMEAGNGAGDNNPYMDDGTDIRDFGDS